MPQQMQPWFHEEPTPALFNSWTWTHFAWGMAARQWGEPAGVGFVAAILLHTVYEGIEGGLFPIEHRDASMRNHVGDTLAFAAGWGVG